MAWTPKRDVTVTTEMGAGTKGAIYRRIISTYYKERLHRELSKDRRLLPVNGHIHKRQGWKGLVKAARPAVFTGRADWSMKPWATEQRFSLLILAQVTPVPASLCTCWHSQPLLITYPPLP